MRRELGATVPTRPSRARSAETAVDVITRHFRDLILEGRTPDTPRPFLRRPVAKPRQLSRWRSRFRVSGPLQPQGALRGSRAPSSATSTATRGALPHVLREARAAAREART